MDKIVSAVVLGVALSIAVSLSVSAVEEKSDDSGASSPPAKVSLPSVSPVEAEGTQSGVDWAVPMFNFP